MKSFYYRLTYNLEQPLIRELLRECSMFDLHDSVSVLTVKSRPFWTYYETNNTIGDDFILKLEALGEVGEELGYDGGIPVTMGTIFNPELSGDPAEAAEVAKQLALTLPSEKGHYSTTLFCLGSVTDDESSDLKAHQWLMKYDVYSETPADFKIPSSTTSFTVIQGSTLQ